MPCYHPLSAGRSRIPLPETGKHQIVFDPKWPRQYESLQLPCGQCLGCRHERARQWAARCVHESQLYDRNCFITLTFNDEFNKPTLYKPDFQNFIKRLRKHYFGNGKSTIRYFHCGEYGENFGRAHHHACLFNFDFPDKVVWKSNSEGQNLFRSPTLEILWPYGYSTIGSVNFDTAAYVARYVIKKINGKLAPGHYAGRQPEYTTMSRRPGIADGWYERYGNTDVFPRDYIVLNGRKQKVPKYYDKKYELTNPDEYATLRSARIEKAKANTNFHPDRLLDAEKIQLAYDAQKPRTYENDKTLLRVR